MGSAEKLIPQAIFLLENAVETLSVSVLCTVVLFRHTHEQTSLPEFVNILVRTILAAAIRVVDWLTTLWQARQRLV
jgi:hypothetical protein